MRPTANLWKLVILVLSGGGLLWSGVRDSEMSGSGVVESLFFTLMLCAIPFAVFAFALWTAKWADQAAERGGAQIRERMALMAQALLLLSSGLYLTIVPCWSLMVEHEDAGAAWVLGGIVSAILGVVCSVLGVPRRWTYAIGCALLVPSWMFAAALIVKAVMD